MIPAMLCPHCAAGHSVVKGAYGQSSPLAGQLFSCGACACVSMWCAVCPSVRCDAPSTLQVLFCFEGSGWRYLSADQRFGAGRQRSREVNCAPQRFAWGLHIYDDVTLDPSPIRVGNPLQLYHKEVDGFFTAELQTDSLDLKARLGAPGHRSGRGWGLRGAVPCWGRGGMCRVSVQHFPVECELAKWPDLGLPSRARGATQNNVSVSCHLPLSNTCSCHTQSLVRNSCLQSSRVCCAVWVCTAWGCVLKTGRVCVHRGSGGGTSRRAQGF